MNHRFSPKGAQAQDQFDNEPRDRWGKAGCSDLCADVGAQLTPAQFRALFFLTRYMNAKTGSAYPSPEALAYDTGMDRNNIRKRLAELVDLGIVRRTRGAPGLPKRWMYWLIDPHEVVRTSSAVRPIKKSTRDEVSDEVHDEVYDEVVTTSKLVKLVITGKELEEASASRTPSASLRSAGASAPRPARSEGHGRFTKDQIIAFLSKQRGVPSYIVQAVVDEEIKKGVLAPDDAGLYQLDQVLM